MKRSYTRLAIIMLLFTGLGFTQAQDEVTIVTPSSEAAEGLDLKAVSELFKESKNLEAFEQALNDPETGVNNLDLDANNEVDYIRVIEQAADDTHIIILQVPLAENEFQDVATIEVEKSEDDTYNMQVHGNEVIYGVNYYVVPSYTRIHTWPVITWIYRPAYRPYRSPYYFGYYPRLWKPYRPASINVYRTRHVKVTRNTTFRISKTSRVKSVRKVNYKPSSSTRVKKTTTVTRTKAKKGGKRATTTRKVKKTTTKKPGKKR